MKSAPVQKIASVLRVLVEIALVCNIVILYLVPAAVLINGGENFLGGIWEYVSGLARRSGDNVALASLIGSLLAWVWVWRWPAAAALTLFLAVSGCCTAVILWQARRVLNTILAENPFSMENTASLGRAAGCCFLIAGAALARLVFNVCYYRSALPLATYNALFVPLFAMAGLLCLVMSALFRQAAELKAESDLTI